MSKKNVAILVIVLILIIDQVFKICIKTHFRLGDEIMPENLEKLY